MLSSSLVLPIEAAALEAAAAVAAAAEAAAAAAAAAAAGGTRGCGLRAMVAVCNGFVELRATTLTFVLPVRVGLDTVAFEAAAAVRAGLAAVEGLRGFGLGAGGDMVPAVVHMEGPVGVSVGGGGDDAGVFVVGGVVLGSGSEPKKNKEKLVPKNNKKQT